MNLTIRNGYLMYVLSVFSKINLSGFGVTEYRSNENQQCLQSVYQFEEENLRFMNQSIWRLIITKDEYILNVIHRSSHLSHYLMTYIVATVHKKYYMEINILLIVGKKGKCSSSIYIHEQKVINSKINRTLIHVPKEQL